MSRNTFGYFAAATAAEKVRVRDHRDRGYEARDHRGHGRGHGRGHDD